MRGSGVEVREHVVDDRDVERFRLERQRCPMGR